MENKVTSNIARELYQKLRQMIANAGFSCVCEFIAFALRNLASTGEISKEMTG